MNDFSIRRIKEGKEFLVYSDTETGTKIGLKYLKDICGTSFVSGKSELFPCNGTSERWGIRVVPKKA
ncbi:MAG: hypothetical protein M0R48_11980 [Candidatus Omnitrophica bacterium]|nr:hypothetical protein [Candidatus Omnitrophota bacterium]